MTRRLTPRWLATQGALTAAVLVAAVVAALTLHAPTAVGPDTLRLVGSASAAAASAGSYRMEMQFSFDGGGAELEVDATADLLASGAGTGRIALPDGSNLRFLTTAEHGWFELPTTSPQRLGGKTWVGFPVSGAQAGMTQDPLEMLAALSDGKDVRDLGEDEVRGVDTRHYAVELDRDALSALAQQQPGGALPGGLPDGVELDGTAELWLDEEALPRRMRVELETGGMTIEMRFDLFEYGVEVDVTPPPADSVVEVPTQQEAMRFLSGR